MDRFFRFRTRLGQPYRSVSMHRRITDRLPPKYFTLLQYRCIDSLAGRGNVFSHNPTTELPTEIDIGPLTPCCEERGKVPVYDSRLNGILRRDDHFSMAIFSIISATFCCIANVNMPPKVQKWLVSSQPITHLQQHF